MTRNQARFIPGEELGTVTDWSFGDVDKASSKFAAKLAAQALADAQVNVNCVSQTLRQVNMQFVIEREDLNMALPADDLVMRAAQSLKRASGTHLGAHIAIEKHIPAQAGMGGGSSNAATTLLTLNRLWGLNWPLPLA